MGQYQDQQTQMIIHHKQQSKDENIMQFASDYPGVMIVIVAVLFAAVAWLVKRKK